MLSVLTVTGNMQFDGWESSMKSESFSFLMVEVSLEIFVRRQRVSELQMITC